MTNYLGSLTVFWMSILQRKQHAFWSPKHIKANMVEYFYLEANKHTKFWLDLSQMKFTKTSMKECEFFLLLLLILSCSKSLLTHKIAIHH